MKAHNISFKGAYLAETTYYLEQGQISRPNKVDNTQSLFQMLNPDGKNSDIVLFKVENSWIVDNRFPKVILTNDGKGKDAARYQKKIKSKWDEHSEKLYHSTIEELRKETKKIIKKQKYELKVEDIEDPKDAYQKRSVPSSTVYRAPYVSGESRLREYIRKYFNTEMYEQSKKFYKSLKIQTIKPEDLLEEGAKILKSVRKYASKA